MEYANLEGGAKKTLTKTGLKVKLGARSAVVYKGERGGKYVKVQGKIVPVREAKAKAAAKK